MKTLVTFALLAASLVAQAPVQVGTVGTNEPPLAKTVLRSGQSMTDSSGRSVENGAPNTNGYLIIKYRGKIREDNGVLVVEGDIETIENPATQGASGNIVINTGGNATTVDLNRNGVQNAVTVTVDGGNATVNVTGSDNNVTVGGASNTVTISGANCTGQGSGSGSSGTVSVTGRNSSFNSNGGTWVTRR